MKRLIVLGNSLDRRQLLMVCGAGATAAACGSAQSGDYPIGSFVDSGPTDTGTARRDAGRTDAGTHVDAGRTDAGTHVDAGRTDAGTRVDAGRTDAGNPVDAGFDAGFPDDTGVVDTDTGPVDTGVTVVDTGPACSPGPTMIGMVSSFAAGTWTMDTGNQIIIGHDSRGLFAFSNICQHAGCAVRLTSRTTGASSCPCHGSQFDGNGAITRGPVRQPMDHYPVTVCDGVVYVDTNTTTSTTDRTPV